MSHPFSPDRRTFVAATGALMTAQPALGTAPSKSVRLNDRFLWGVATAAHQVEGNNINSDWWLLENLGGLNFKDVSGDACDHYHLYEQDISLLKAFGFNSYRFSIEWARIEPVAGTFSKAEIDHYRRMLIFCRKLKLKTVVTLHHFTSPIWFAAKGGFENAQAPELFARYAEHVVRELGDLIDVLCTFNEANLSFAARVPLADMKARAARACGAETFSSFLFDDIAVSRPIIKQCHTAARLKVKAITPKLPVGFSLSLPDIQDAPGQSGAAEEARDRLQRHWLEFARADDYIGIQTYTRDVYGKAGRIPPDPAKQLTQIGQEIYPPAMAGAVRYAWSVARVPVIITENGIGIEDDRVRIQYLDDMFQSLRDCVTEGIDLRGYIHWSLMDNFEWMRGYAPKFGLVSVDRATQARTPKPSAYHLGAIARRNRF